MLRIRWRRAQRTRRRTQARRRHTEDRRSPLEGAGRRAVWAIGPHPKERTLRSDEAIEATWRCSNDVESSNREPSRACGGMDRLHDRFTWAGNNCVVRVLVAEDDTGLRSVLERGLSENGYVVDAVADGEVALRFLRAYEYDAVVLDWRMPRLAGIDVVRALRRRGSNVPILMLTALDTHRDRIAGLDEGADDYLVKPFDFGELLARIRALQRRSPSMHAPQLAVGDVEFDPVTRHVQVGSRDPALTNTELSILEILMRRSPGVVERRSIALHVWNDEADTLGSNTMDVHVARLRAKLGKARARIETVRGVGFRMVAT